MAKGRMLDKSISASYQIQSLPDPMCKLLATWLISHLDKNGVFYGDAPMVRSQVLPLEDVTNAQVETWLRAMENAIDGDSEPLIRRFTAKGRLWLCFPGFDRHQAGLHKEREGTSFPNPPGQDEQAPTPQPAPVSDLPAKVQQSPEKLQQLPAKVQQSPDKCKGKEGNQKEKESNLTGSEHKVMMEGSPERASARTGTSDGLSPGQSQFLVLFGAKRFKNSVQRETVQSLADTYGIEALLGAGRWAAMKGMSLGDGIAAVQKALPKWGNGPHAPPTPGVNEHAQPEAVVRGL